MYMTDCFFIQHIRSFQKYIHSLDHPGGTHACFVDQLSPLPLQKGHLGSQGKNILSFPWSTFYRDPTYAFYPFLGTGSSLVLYAAVKNSLLLDQLQINNSDSCESWHAFAFICQYLTCVKNVNYRYCVSGKYASTSLVSLWCFWSWIRPTLFCWSPQILWNHRQVGSGSRFCSMVQWCSWPVGWGVEYEPRMMDIQFLALSALSASDLKQPSCASVSYF